MYAEATGQQSGAVARLLSKTFTPDPNVTEVCWKFNYYMKGSEMGSLAFWVR